MFETLSLESYLPSLIMFGCTVIFAAVFYWPALRFPRKDKVINFYWSGFWGFLAMITAISGGKATLELKGYDVAVFSKAILAAMTVTFTIFVVFAWFRLVLKGVRSVTKKAVA